MNNVIRIGKHRRIILARQGDKFFLGTLLPTLEVKEISQDLHDSLIRFEINREVPHPC